MTQSNPKAPFPTGTETAIFRAFEQVLRADSVLGPAVKQWVTWKGSNEDLIEPTYSTCPFLRLSPAPASSDWATEGQHLAPLSVRVQLAVAGTLADNLLNYWAAVRNALFPQSLAAKQTVQAVIQAAGASKPILRLAAYGVALDEKTGARLLIADGSIDFVTLVLT